jgi:hypothetical protein
MKICEVCGLEEKLTQEESNQEEIRTLHLCEACRTDRSFHSELFFERE